MGEHPVVGAGPEIQNVILETHTGDRNPNRRQMRWWMPATMLVLAGAASVYLRSREVPFLEPILIGIGLLTVLLLGLWYIFLTGLRWRTRLLLVLISAGLLAGIY